MSDQALGRGVRAIDPTLVGAVLLGLAVRWLPVWLYGFGPVVRDEAQYRNLARMIVEGQGLQAPHGWLWAPGYPYLIAAFQAVFPWPVTTSVPYAQGLLGALTCVTLYAIVRRAFPREGLGAARLAALMYALHPTFAFFAGRLWCEGVYGPLLLLTVWAALWARDGGWGRMVVPGALLGLCVLFRGVATYMPPIFVLAALWPSDGQAWGEALRARGRGAAALLLATTLTVAPYSIQASVKHEGLILSDATVGNLMYLGNNDFEPLTFDWGNGVLGGVLRTRLERQGRPECPAEDPIRWNRCETQRGLKWIQENPREFVARVPMRVAQLLTPHTFLTRALRWGKYNPPFWVKEGLIAGVALSSILILVGGTVGAVARARGPYGVLAWGIVLYTVAASAGLYGLSRFRVPVEPLWIVFLASALAHPRLVVASLRAEPWRLALAVVLVPLVAALTLWYLPAAYPGFGALAG